MTRLGWLLLSDAALPDDDDWLEPIERASLEALRFERRRRDWRLGRFAARVALKGCPWLEGVDLRGVRIESDANGAPALRLPTGEQPCALSLSHRAGWGLCALAPQGARVGCDLERVEPRSETFIRDYFTELEYARVEREQGRARDVVANAVWCAKECAVKMTGSGWRVDTRSVVVECLGESSGPGGRREGWRSLRVRAQGEADAFSGWWRELGDAVMALVAAPPTPPPVWLGPGGEPSPAFS